MSATIQIAYNAVVAKIVNPTTEVKNIVSNVLSYMVEGVEHMGAFKSGHWNGRSTFFAHGKSTFPAGFTHLVHAELVRYGYKVQFVRKPLPSPLGPTNPIVDEFGNDDPRYDYQMQTIEALLKHGRGIAQIATGGGKCLGRDTPILMFDGTIKPVQDVVVGDLLMGPDSKPRRVLSTCSGRDPLYRVTPNKGDAYVVNNAHILSLKKTSRGYRGLKRDGEKYPKGEIVNINVEAYLAQHNTFRHVHKGWRTGVDFESTGALAVDPYFLGALLGDGGLDGTVTMTTADSELVEEIARQAERWGLQVRTYNKPDNAASTYHLTQSGSGGRSNPLMAALRSLGLSHGNKHIPHCYKTSSRVDRLSLLAGLIDTDGYYDGKGFYVTLKNERLLDDLIFVARSLGFAAYKRAVTKRCTNNGVDSECFTTVISGNLDEIPVRLERRKASSRRQKKDHLVTGLTVEPIGEGDYYGFEIDGDHLFLLGDFTVTHNTKIAKLAIARIRRMTLFVTTRSVLLYQMKKALEKSGFGVGMLGDGEFTPRQGVNVAMVQTLIARLKETTVGDERRALIARQTNKGKEIVKLDQEALQKEAVANFERKTLLRDQTIAFLNQVEFVIGEEAHEAGGNSYYEILQHCKNASYRLALTATPFMRENAEDNMRLMAAFGPVLIQVSEQTLIDRGILARPFFKFIRCDKPPKLFRTTPWQRAYKIGIVENMFRNAHIIREARRAVAAKMPVMILVQRKDHGTWLAKAFEKFGVKARFIQGETDEIGRQKALRELGNGKLQILIGTTILDVGVDVPSVSMVILAGGGKAEVALRQRIGRGLRAKKGANYTFVVDFADNDNITLKEHAMTRRAIVEATPGFAENILPEGKDFDWSLFEAAKAA